jgi:Ca2+-binding EF-hand superfamily protein
MNFSVEELTLFKSAFNTFASNNSEITIDDLLSIMGRVGEQFSDQELALFFQHIGKPTLNFDQFIKFATSNTPPQKTKLESIFELLDADKSGAITQADLQRSFQNLNIGDDISKELQSAMISAIDSSGKGEISFHAFKRAFGNIV